MGRNNTDFSGDKNPNYKKGYCMNSKTSTFYNSWQNMKQRCLNKKHPKYHRYGGRGVEIHTEWLEINNFAEWALSNGWEKGLTLDRIDNDGNYCPDNCEWVSMSDNSRKKSTSKLNFKQAEEIRRRVIAGEKEKDLAVEYGVVHGTIWFIVKGYTHVRGGKHSRKKKETRAKNAKQLQDTKGKKR